MTHDIQDLLNLIKELEERIIVLELNCVQSARQVQNSDGWADRWYFDY